ncbi:MFS transporter [Methylomonas methanica]|uniref:Major facilitator superfamily MFS_1 n=1 Tax=Methylomonas methanica (strain DSM 25384 / MC09) TaxID=857087 RepID=F9ZYF2_METMM|nr:MFS transporter [Methylomonas methanica]AEG01057.1 major facilitator superfamily MFS_1 [Methylomonas methanica MC09]
MKLPYWRLSGFYFCYFAILGAFLPFWSLYLKQIGFTATDIGELTGMLVATKIVAPYLWSWLADKTGRCLRLIRITSLFSTLTFCGFLVRHDYSWAAGVTVAFSFFWNATLPQFEAATLTHLKAEPQRYSRIRLWGSVGFIAAVLGIGRFLDDFSIDYLPWIIIGLLLSNWLMALVTPEAVASHDNKAADSVRRILFKPELLAFFSVYMLLQVAHGPYYVFYSVFLQQHGYSTTLTGFLWALGVCAEILVFIWMYGLFKYISLRGLLLGSLALSMLRWLMIAYGVDSLPVIVAAQLLHAASFGIAHVVAMQLLYRYFGDRHQSKGQALYSSLSFGLGGMLGSFYSGYLWDALGGGPVFVIAALACGVAFLIAFIGVGRQKPVTLG